VGAFGTCLFVIYATIRTYIHTHIHTLTNCSLSCQIATEPENRPHSWLQTPYTWEDIATVARGNRIVSTPYTKRMMSMDRVDQAAGVLMMSVAEARRRGEYHA
jgi:acetyl-CoA C-acetyltransferase